MADKPSVYGRTNPPDDAQEVTVGVDLQSTSRAIHLPSAGNVEVIMAKGTQLTISNMAAGWHVINITQVVSTTVTGTIIAFF